MSRLFSDRYRDAGKQAMGAVSRASGDTQFGCLWSCQAPDLAMGHLAPFDDAAAFQVDQGGVGDEDGFGFGRPLYPPFVDAFNRVCAVMMRLQVAHDGVGGKLNACFAGHFLMVWRREE